MMVRNLIYLTIVILVCILLISTARGQEHQHPVQDIPLHEQFYSTWFMPDNPFKSCCNKADCYPTQASFFDGQWHALRREDGQWLPVPWEKIERNRDNPDGNSHVCAPPPEHYGDLPKTVFCFSLGGGT